MENIVLLSSSKYLIDGLPLPFAKPLAKMRLAYITTAAKPVADKAYVERTISFLKVTGCNYFELDLDGQTPDSLRAVLYNVDVVFVEGGNAYYLLKSIRDSGFESVVKELLSRGVWYMGACAGTHVAGPNINMADWRQKPDYNHFAISDTASMGLVPFATVVHYIPEFHGLLKQKIAATKYPIKILSDKQALFIQNGVVKLIGEGKEVNL
jgi:peptidase E